MSLEGSRRRQELKELHLPPLNSRLRYYWPALVWIVFSKNVLVVTVAIGSTHQKFPVLPGTCKAVLPWPCKVRGGHMTCFDQWNVSKGSITSGGYFKNQRLMHHPPISKPSQIEVQRGRRMLGERERLAESYTHPESLNEDEKVEPPAYLWWNVVLIGNKFSFLQDTNIWDYFVATA